MKATIQQLKNNPNLTRLVEALEELEFALMDLEDDNETVTSDEHELIESMMDNLSYAMPHSLKFGLVVKETV